MLEALFNIIVFPGLLFLGGYALVFNFIDRKLHARLQNRKGPCWYQPLADFLKLLGKETIIPAEADKAVFKVLPILSLSVVVAAYLYIPTWRPSSIYPFNGDLIVVLYLLTLPTLFVFWAAWYSTSVYATIGATRVLTQMFAYEVPMFMALLAPALLAGTWSLTGIHAYYTEHPLYLLINLPAFFVALVASQGKLARVPFDLPEAETELAGGIFVEYSGRLYAIFRLAMDSELVVLCSLMAAIFLPFYSTSAILSFLSYILQTLFILLLLSVFRTIMARLRIEQVVNLYWKYLTPLAMIQIIANLLLKGVLN